MGRSSGTCGPVVGKQALSVGVFVREGLISLYAWEGIITETNSLHPVLLSCASRGPALYLPGCVPVLHLCRTGVLALGISSIFSCVDSALGGGCPCGVKNKA